MIDLTGPGSYLDWGWLQISWANAIVILLMIVAFAAALVLPFPGHDAAGDGPPAPVADHSAADPRADGGRR